MYLFKAICKLHNLLSRHNLHNQTLFFEMLNFLFFFFQPWEVQTLITVLLDWENLCHDTLETPIGLYLDF